ncbi:MAG: hypothetical protein ABUL62_17100 [Myxococcales bacterium]
MAKPDSEVLPELVELRRAVRAHLDAGVAIARRGLAVARSAGNGESTQFFDRCLSAMVASQGVARSLDAEPARESSIPSESGEEVSSATFASGDGANDAQVTPEEGRGRPGTWPSY